MSLGAAIAAALTFVWLGLVLAISFLEAPLKFRAPGVTLQIGVGIGRLVFRALNTVEALLAVGILIALVAGHPPVGFIVAFAIVVVGLLVQLLRAAAVEAPLRCGVGRSECPSLARPLRLRCARSDQAGCLGHGRISPAYQLNRKGTNRCNPSL